MLYNCEVKSNMGHSCLTLRWQSVVTPFRNISVSFNASQSVGAMWGKALCQWGEGVMVGGMLLVLLNGCSVVNIFNLSVRVGFEKGAASYSRSAALHDH